MLNTISYPDLSSMSWWDIQELSSSEERQTQSVHIPLNFPAAERLVYCDCAMNAYVLEAPALNTSVPADGEIRARQRVKMLSFGFGEVPFVPDCRQVRLSRRLGGLPIIRAEFSAWDGIYDADYCVDPAGVLHIRMTVTNEFPKPRMMHVWLKPQEELESKLFDYHYVTYNWDAARWFDDPAVSYKDGELQSNGETFGRLAADGWQVDWVEQQENDVSKVNQLFRCATPYHVHAPFRLAAVSRVIHLQKELKQGETAAFELSLAGQGAWQDSMDYATAETQAVAAWKTFTAGKPSLSTGSSRLDDMIEAIRLNDLQLLLKAGGALRPCQGGLSERFYVWVWEAVCALRPLLRLGHFAEVRKVIEFIFSLQDGGCPPQGEFTTVKGAIGTSGPKWANTTGAALMLAADYLDYSGDRNFLADYLDKMLAAGRWIIGEITATRKDGSPVSGILPPACASDGDYGQLVFTEAWTCGGLSRLCDVLNGIRHPAAAEFTAELQRYRDDLKRVLYGIATPDGFIDRCLGPDHSHVCNEFRFTDTALDFCMADVYTADEPVMKNYLRWLERNAFHGFFCSEVTRGIYYIGNNELSVMRMYLELGEWKQAWMAARVFQRFAVTQDVYLTQERYHENDTGFTAWQPNGSNDGRFLELQMTRFIHTTAGRIILLGGFAPAERQRNWNLNGIYTIYGRTSLTRNGDDVTLSTERPIPAGTVIETPWQKLTVQKDVKEISITMNDKE